jgi:uncharacterized protein (DUF4415 family)
MSGRPIKKASDRNREAREIATLAALPDGAIDTEALPERRNWSGAIRGRFYRPVKQQLTIRLDADVVAWFKANASDGRYQSGINRALREFVSKQDKRRKAS